MAKKSRARYNNEFHVENSKADEIRALPNDALLGRCTMEYKNWMASVKMKKEDSAIAAVKSAMKEIRDGIKEDPEYIKLEEEFKAKKEELITEELADYQEQLKNLIQPYNEDVAEFRGLFRVAIEELDARKGKGLLNAKDAV